MKLTFVGGASTVTGSCYHLQVGKFKFLVECGLHQGNGSDELNRNPYPFNPAELDLIFVTHAHIDHSGMLPKAVRDGFMGKVISTAATKDLLEPMLYDAASIQESDSEWLTRRAMRTGRPPAQPLYTTEDVEKVLPLFEVKEYNKIYHLGGGVKFRFLDAGHILGSASLEIWYQDSDKEKKIVFSGDIGKKGNPIIKDPSAPSMADYVVMESTYGNRSHRPLAESINELVSAIKTTFRKGGNVYIPSFAVGRSQDLLYIINNLVREGRLYRIDVYLDSPLAEEVTRVYVAHPECFDDEARRLFTTRQSDTSMRLHFVRTAEESMKLNRLKSGNIIIAGSGMCEGGRIKHHLKHNLWRSECSVIFVGYQAENTLGRRIIDGARSVNVLGEEVLVRASIYTINGFSAHAGREELVEWLSAFDDTPTIFIVHGEDESAESFSKLVKEKYGFNTHRPKDGETVEI
ncbi:MAG TPA: MBL fold hydrolase [Deltaproteobacteria bacterium]|nr:MAG: MBL fold hydrolase [Deltaproteobacteria bacterium GWA2_55_82]OGQ62639.1 MAG: MBL fold hydrolase [Deltaproteobacteria bacterium RIFCSPLOWO2_02_FULL_55_12]OIJ74231.1 MAG: MBL fold hydrolase [Deltaproteobacteria bacterium GWC2_55_46]HBG46855.1 MBL fold hydrolase [Deltaproteobacteria bacterium]HCY11087.1 MBL fold hydrolase [Deltaproteobacteria bacterium]